MKNRLLTLGGAVVALLLVGLVWVVRSDGRRSVAPPVPRVAADAAPAGASPSVAPSASTPASAPADAAPTTTAPADPATSPPAPAGDTPPRIVHDHSGETPPPGSPLTPDTVFAVRQSLTPLVQRCAEPLVRAGSSGSLTLVARFNIASGKVSATPMSVSHTQWKDADFDACVQKAISELALDAPSGQIDASYRLAMPFKFP